MTAKHTLQLGARRDRLGYPFYLEPAARFQHAFVVGQTGTGKSTLLKSMALHDIHAGHGVTFIDPHGTEVDELLDRIPTHRHRDVLLIDPTDTETVVSINPFIDEPPSQRPLVAENFVQYMRYLWADSWGPQLENILRNTALVILSLPRSECPSIAIIPLLLSPSQTAYREHVLKYVEDRAVRDFFINFGNWPERQIHERTQSVLNKVQQLLTTPTINILLSTTATNSALTRAIPRRSIILARLPKGHIGAHATKILGSVIASSLQQNAMAQSETDPIPHYLYMDEVRNFITPASVNAYSELRKFKLSITAAAQYCKQLPDPILDAIFGNVGTFIVFRVIDSDATRLAGALKGYRDDAYTELGRGEVIAKTIYQNETHGPFSATVDLAPHPFVGQSHTIRTRQRRNSPLTHETATERLNDWYRSIPKKMQKRAEPKPKRLPPAAKKNGRAKRKPTVRVVGSGGKQETVFDPTTNTIITCRFD